MTDITHIGCHTGTGTTPHRAIEEFSEKAGIQPNPIPFKGSAQIMSSILGATSA